MAETLREHPRPGSNSNGQLVAAPLSHGSNPNSNAVGRRREDDENLVAYALRKDPGGTGQGHNTNYVTGFHMLQDPISEDDLVPAWGKGNKIGSASIGVAFSENQRAELLETEVAHQLTSGGGKPGQGYPATRQGSSVRRLTPTECERLQGLPDGWTQLGDTADSKRYAALGDAVTATVAEWIGRRIIAADGIEFEVAA